jgi:hypothetical protein
MYSKGGRPEHHRWNTTYWRLAVSASTSIGGSVVCSPADVKPRLTARDASHDLCRPHRIFNCVADFVLVDAVPTDAAEDQEPHPRNVSAFPVRATYARETTLILPVKCSAHLAKPTRLGAGRRNHGVTMLKAEFCGASITQPL